MHNPWRLVYSHLFWRRFLWWDIVGTLIYTYLCPIKVLLLLSLFSVANSQFGKSYTRFFFFRKCRHMDIRIWYITQILNGTLSSTRKRTRGKATECPSAWRHTQRYFHSRTLKYWRKRGGEKGKEGRGRKQTLLALVMEQPLCLLSLRIFNSFRIQSITVIIICSAQNELHAGFIHSRSTHVCLFSAMLWFPNSNCVITITIVVAY